MYTCALFSSPTVPRLWASFCRLRFLCPSPMALPVLCSKYAFQSGWSFYFNTLLHPPPAPVQAEDRRQERRLPSHSPGLESRTAGPPILRLISSTPCMWVFLYTIRNCSLNFTSFFYLLNERNYYLHSPPFVVPRFLFHPSSSFFPCTFLFFACL